MLPFPHTLLQFVLCFLGALVGGVALKAIGEANAPGRWPGLLEFLGGAAGFLAVYFLWDRCVPIRCPNCGGRLMKENMRWGPRFTYSCDSCGRMQ
jgi:hypothetical protein